jgi:hypothetical protein
MQQWLHERAPMLRWYVYCLSCFSVIEAAVVSYNLALSPNTSYGRHWARNRQKYIMTIMCRHNMSNTNVSQTKAIYLRREVLCKTWWKYSLWKFQGVCEPKVSCCTFWEAVFQFRIILRFGLVKRSLFYNESKSAGSRLQGQSPILSRMCHHTPCGVQLNCPLHFEDVNFHPIQMNRLNLTSYILVAGPSSRAV